MTERQLLAQQALERLAAQKAAAETALEVPQVPEEVPEVPEEVPQAVDEVVPTSDTVIEPQQQVAAMPAEQTLINVDEVPETPDEVPQASDEVPETLEQVASRVAAAPDDVVEPGFWKAATQYVNTPEGQEAVATKAAQAVQAQQPAVQQVVAAPTGAYIAPSAVVTAPSAAVAAPTVAPVGAVVQQPQQPIVQPQISAVTPQTTVPTQVAAPVPTTTPSVTQVQKEVQKQMAPIQQANAKVDAAKRVQEYLATEEEIARNQQSKAQDSLNEVNERVRVKSLPEIMKKGTFGEKFTAVVAVLLGGVSQGLTRAQTNPVIDFIDRAVAQQAAEDKLVKDEKIALRQLALQEAKNRVDGITAITNDFKVKEALNLQSQKLSNEIDAANQKRIDEAVAKQQRAGMYSGNPLTPEQKVEMTVDDRMRVMYLPDIPGFEKRRMVLTSNPEAAKQWNTEIVPSATQAINLLGKLEDLYKISAIKRKTLPEYSATVEALRLPLSAMLRVPLTGPGPLTETEREMLLAAIANPTRMFDFFGTEKIKLEAIRSQMLATLRENAKARGVNVPVVPIALYNDNGILKTEKMLLDEYKRANPDVSEQELLLRIRKMTKAD